MPAVPSSPPGRKDPGSVLVVQPRKILNGSKGHDLIPLHFQITKFNGSVEIPCFGTMTEIHRALIDHLDWLGKQVIINGRGYTIVEKGFVSNLSKDRVYEPDNEGFLELLAPGTAILIGDYETTVGSIDKDEYINLQEIITTGGIPHVSRRCKECGMQLKGHEIPRQVCDSCYSAAVNL